MGKDYAAADKGKTFSKGGEMKESKGMVGKEVAFFKKKGAPKSMIKHEQAEMKGYARGGKVRRMAGGGMGDPFDLSDTDRENYAKNGAENLKRLKGFFGFGDKEESKPPSSTTMDRPSSGGGIKLPAAATTSRVSNQSPRTRRGNEDTSDSDAVERSDAASRDKTTNGPQFTGSLNGGFEDNAPAQRESKVGSGASGFNQTPYQDSGFSALNPVAKRRPRTVSVEKNKTKVTTSNKIPAAIDSEKLLKDSEEDVLRKKPTAMTEQMRKAPTINDLYAGQKSMGEEIGGALKSFRESIRGGLQKGKERQESKGSTMYAKGGNVKRMRYGGEPDSGMDMGQPMRGMAPIPRGRGMPAMGPEAPRVIEKPMNGLEGQMPRPDYEKPGYQLPMERPMPAAGPRIPIDTTPKAPKLLPGQKPEELFDEINRAKFNSGMMQPSRPGNSPQPDGPSRGIKAGGQVKKMAQGGYAKADGVASRGKTQPKMVKMAKGGFVKTADGCAQRGKTKAFQVKMNRGGKC